MALHLIHHPACQSSCPSAARTAVHRSTCWSRIPAHLFQAVLTQVSLSDVARCASVCRSWRHLVLTADNSVWRHHCRRLLPSAASRSDLLLSLPSWRERVRALQHSWNPSDCSPNMYVKLDGLTVHRQPVAQSTDAARARRGYSSGRHAWTVVWRSPLGTAAALGVATAVAHLHCSSGYSQLLGVDRHSWAWNLTDNTLHRAGTGGDGGGEITKPRVYPALKNAAKYQTGEKVTMILDCGARTLSFERQHEFLGVAFSDLPCEEALYPVVSVVYGHSEVSLLYLGSPLDG